MLGVGVGVTLVLFVLGIVLTIVWIIMPFAVFGIKSRLDKALHHLDVMNSNLVELGVKLDDMKLSSGEDTEQTE